MTNSPVKHILSNLENVLLSMSWLHNKAGPSNTFLINLLLLLLKQLHKTQDIIVAIRIHDKIGQSMLSEECLNIEYHIEIKEAINNAHKFL